MPKNDPFAGVELSAQASALLKDPAALQAILQSDEARALAQVLQRMEGDGLQQAAQSAAAGDPAALGAILQQVRTDPKGAQALAAMDKLDR